MRLLMIPILLLSLAQVSSARCDPDGMVKIVARETTPELGPGDFAAKPKTLYRWGSHYGRLEEEPDSALGLHALVIVNNRNMYMVNLFSKIAHCAVDQTDTYDFKAPLISTPGDSGEFRDLEMGCELEFMTSHGVEPKEITVSDRKLLEYETTIDNKRIRLLVLPEKKVPWMFESYAGNKLEFQLQYDEYDTELEPDSSLFELPKGIKIESGR